uniref:Clavilactone A biosynthesis cluster protein Y n=1 Tax=Ampulloclitocybe clavipes TaxID=56467 RepID=CLAY_AMPCV
MLIPCWDSAGQIHHLEGFPTSFKDWSRGEELSAQRREFLSAVEKVTPSSISSTRDLAVDMNLTLEVTLDDGQVLVVRQCYPSQNDDVEELWRTSKFESEVNLMQWLEQNSRIPVPSIHSVMRRGTDSPAHFIIMSKLPGQVLMNSHSLLSSLAKVFALSHLTVRNTVLELFRLDVPQRIGTTIPSNPGDGLDVRPKIGKQYSLSADRVFDTLEEYMRHLFSLKRKSKSIGDGDTDKARAYSTLTTLEDLVNVHLKSLTSPSLRRCVLMHDDLHDANILVDIHGNITGVLDWEFHSIQPAVLAVGYPAWLSYDDTNDPRFASSSVWWVVGRQESIELRRQYAMIVKVKDLEYYEALVAGLFLRSVVNWLIDEHADPGCLRLRGWMISEEALGESLTQPDQIVPAK